MEHLKTQRSYVIYREYFTDYWEWSKFRRWWWENDLSFEINRWEDPGVWIRRWVALDKPDSISRGFFFGDDIVEYVEWCKPLKDTGSFYTMKEAAYDALNDRENPNYNFADFSVCKTHKSKEIKKV